MNSRLRWLFTICVTVGVAFLSLSGWVGRGQLRANASALANEPMALKDVGSESASNHEALSDLAQAHPPQVWAFEVTPLVTAEKITIAWNVVDEIGQDLDRVGVLRAADLNGHPDPDSWIELLDLRRDVSSYDNFPSNYGSVEDTPPAGISWYSLYVTDKAGNAGFARDPIRVTSTRVRGGPGDIQPSFQDVSYDHWAFDDIEILYRNGFTRGCSGEGLEYCPAQDLTRAEYAVFAERAQHSTSHIPADPEVQYFIDTLLGDWFTNWVEGLRLDGLTAGCVLTPSAFCPLRGLPRKEGAVIALRIMNGQEYKPPSPVGIFADAKEGEWSDAWAEAAFHAGLLAPCEPGWEPKFCPDRPLTRAMTAHMMVAAKGLTLSFDITSIHMLDAMHGWATGDPENTHILRTTDGGITWQDVTPDEAAFERSEFFFLNPMYAWMVSFQNHLDPTVWRTQDGGRSWEMSHLYSEPLTPGAPSHESAWIEFTDPDHGWLALRYTFGATTPSTTVLYQTTDSGATWKHSPIPCPGEAFDFADAQNGWMACGAAPLPKLLQTADGGQNWRELEVSIPYNGDVYLCIGASPFLFSPTSGALLIGCWREQSSASSEYLLYRTLDGGQTWSYSSLPGDSSQLVAPHYNVQFVDPLSAILFGPDGYPPAEPFQREFHRTLDGGQTWEKMGSLPWSGQLSFIDIDRGWILVESDGHKTLLYTADGGRTWNPISPDIVP